MAGASFCPQSGRVSGFRTFGIVSRYSNEFEGRHNRRPLDTIDQMGMLARSADGKRLRYEDLVA